MHIDCLAEDIGASVGDAEQTGRDAMRGTFGAVRARVTVCRLRSRQGIREEDRAMYISALL